MFKILTIILLISAYSHDSIRVYDIEKKFFKNQYLSNQFDWNGEYNLFIKGEKLSGGEMSGRDYTFIIKQEKVILKTNSFHEPVFCEGDYIATEKNNQLLIVYAGYNSNFCKQNEPNFTIKKEKNIFFIKGSDFNSIKWLLLKKKK